MWSLNGHSLSKVFTGSRSLEGKAKVGLRQGGRVGAPGTPLTACGLGSWQVGKLKDGARSMSRTIQSNFFDGVKQEAIKLLLVGDVYGEEMADKGGMLLDSTALLGRARHGQGEAGRRGAPRPHVPTASVPSREWVADVPGV